MRIFNIGLMIDAVDNGFQMAMKKVSTGDYLELNCGVPNFNQVVVEMARNFQPDLIFIQTQANLITAQTANELSKIAFCMTFNGDIRHTLPTHYSAAERDFQLHTFSNMRDVKEARNLGMMSDWLELGVDPSRFCRHPNPLPAPKVVFMGNNYGEGRFELSQFRIDAVNRLTAEFGDDFGCYGTGWSNCRENLNGNQIDESRTYNGAQVAVSISHFLAEKYSSDRLLRTLASGCATVVHHYPSIEECYTPGKHLLTFSPLEEMVSQIRYLLDHPIEREEIAQAGMKHVVDNFSFDKMCENIVLLYQKYSKI